MTDWDIQGTNTTDWDEEARPPLSPEGFPIIPPTVFSVFGRVGNVAAVAADYESALVSITPPISAERPWGNVRLFLANLSTQVDDAQAAADAAQVGGPFLPIDGSQPLTGPLTVDSANPSAVLKTAGTSGDSEFWRDSDGTATGLWADSPGDSTLYLEPRTAGAANFAYIRLFNGANQPQNNHRTIQIVGSSNQNAATAAINTAGDGLNWTGKQNFAHAVTVTADPTAALGVATKQYVDAIAAAPPPDWSLIPGKPATFPPSPHAHPIADVTGLQPALDLLAPLASPAFTGNPTAPTPAPGDADTSVATTAFVANAVSLAGGALPASVPPLMDGVAAVGVSTKYAREDHKHPTDTSLTTKTYVDTADALAMPKSGGTFTGPVTWTGSTGQVNLNMLTSGTTDASWLYFGSAGGATLGGVGYTFSNDQLMFRVLSNSRMYLTSGALRPVTDGTTALGTTSGRWASAYALTHFVGTANIPIQAGTATPEAAVTAPVGSLFMRTDGGVGTALYVKQSGAGNTGWGALADATTAIQAAMSAEDNLLINGGMQVWQRGATFFGLTAGGSKTVDRWGVTPGTGSTTAITRAVAAPGSANLREVLVWQRSTTGSGAGYIFQNIEDVRTAAGQTVTISFEIYTQVATTSALSVSWYQGFGTGGSPSADVDTAGPTFSTAAATWERKIVSMAVPSVSGKTIGTNGNDYAEPYFTVPTSFGNNQLQITNVDVRLGTVAPAQFLRRPQQQELALCQRYYQVYNSVVVSGYGLAAANIYTTFTLTPGMRAVPTTALSGISYTTNAGNFLVNGVDSKQVRLTATATAAGHMFAYANVALDAEL